MVSSMIQKKKGKLKLLNIPSWYQYMAARLHERANILIGCRSKKDGPLLSARDFPCFSRGEEVSMIR